MAVSTTTSLWFQPKSFPLVLPRLAKRWVWVDCGLETIQIGYNDYRWICINMADLTPTQKLQVTFDLHYFNARALIGYSQLFEGKGKS